MDVKTGELEELFERYRSQQDLRALSKLFDLAAPELLRLAVHMAPDVASAEDLVQQTFLAAIEKPARWRASEPLLPWLFGILAKLAKKQRRALRRSPEPDRLATRSAEDPARSTLEAETRASIHSALEALPELYREVVRASLFDEKPPHEIARELERAPGTVRMQLLRGLEMLRRALPGGIAGGALVLCGTRGEAALKAAVLEKAAVAPAVLATSSLTIGGLLVSTKAVLAVVVAVTGLCAWLLWPRPAPQETPALAHEGTPQQAVVAGEHERPIESALAVSAPEPERSAIESAPATTAAQARPAGIFLVGKVTGVASEHMAEVELHVGTSRGNVDGRVQSDGTFELDLETAVRKAPDQFGLMRTVVTPKPIPGESIQLDIWARHPRYISEHEALSVTDLFAPLEPGKRREVRRDLHMRAAAVVSGRVRVPQGWDLGQANVQILARTPDPADVLGLSEEHSGCDAQGNYSIKSMRRGECLVRAELPGLLPAAVYVNVEPGGELVLPEFVLEESRCAIRGRVDLPARLLQAQSRYVWVAPDGSQHVQVWAQRVGPAASAPAIGALGGMVLDARSASRERELRGGCAVVQQHCVIAQDMSFSLLGLEPGQWELTFQGIQAHGTLPLLEKTIVEAPADGIVLGEQLGSIELTVVDSHGRVAGAGVTVGDGETYTSFVAGDDGLILLLGDLRKDYTASAGAAGRENVELALPGAGRAREAKFELRLSDAPQPAALVFRPAEAASAPQAVQVYLDPVEGQSGLRERSEKLALTGGRYQLAGVLPGHWRIRVGPAEEQIPVAFFGGYLISERFETTLAPGATFERALRCEQGGRLRVAVEADASLKSNGLGCELRSLDGKSVDAPTFVSSMSGEGFGIFGASEHLMIMSEHTQVALQDCLPPGRYELRLTSATMHAKPLTFEIKVGETTQADWKID